MAHLILTARQRSHFGKAPSASFRLATHTHIPGSVVRGAFAAAWIARHGIPTSSSRRAEFVELFEGPTVFGPLYSDHPPTSLSIWVHKYPPRQECRTHAWDAANSGTEVPTHCKQCKSPLRQAKPSDRPPTASPSAIVSRTHVAIAEDGVAEDGRLFRREQHSPTVSPHYQGHVHGSSTTIDALADFSSVRVGGRLTTHGGMSVAFADRPYRPPTPINTTDIVLRLISPAIFVDDRGAAAPHPHPVDLQRVLGSPARVVRSWMRWGETGGWHAASGLPKHTERTVEPGSTYLVRSQTSIDHDSLHRLGEGLGLRRHEGFGAVGDLNHDPIRWWNR